MLVNSNAQTPWVHTVVTVTLDTDLHQMDLHAMTLMSVERIQIAVLKTAQIHREATIVLVALDTTCPVIVMGAWVR
jgi:hypothetical protein